MLKTAVHQGRSKRSGEEVQTSLRVDRSPLEWILANGKAPPAIPTSENLLWYVEGLNDARTMHGKRRVLARRGRAGEKSDFFSVLLIVRWFEVARWTVLPGDCRLFGLFDEATQIHFRCAEQLRFAALHDSGQQDVQRTIHP